MIASKISQGRRQLQAKLGENRFVVEDADRHIFEWNAEDLIGRQAIGEADVAHFIAIQPALLFRQGRQLDRVARQGIATERLQAPRHIGDIGTFAAIQRQRHDSQEVVKAVRSDFDRDARALRREFIGHLLEELDRRRRVALEPEGQGGFVLGGEGRCAEEQNDCAEQAEQAQVYGFHNWILR